MHSTYSKEYKTLFIFVYTTEKRSDPSQIYPDIDHHLLTVEITPQSMRIYPNVPFSLPAKRLGEERLMFMQDSKDYVASLCADCSEDQKWNCLHNKGPCRKLR